MPPSPVAARAITSTTVELPKASMRLPITRASTICASIIEVQSREMALPLMSLLCGQGLSSSVPVSYGDSTKGEIKNSRMRLPD